MLKKPSARDIRVNEILDRQLPKRRWTDTQLSKRLKVPLHRVFLRRQKKEIPRLIGIEKFSGQDRRKIGNMYRSGNYSKTQLLKICHITFQTLNKILWLEHAVKQPKDKSFKPEKSEFAGKSAKELVCSYEEIVEKINQTHLRLSTLRGGRKKISKNALNSPEYLALLGQLGELLGKKEAILLSLPDNFRRAIETLQTQNAPIVGYKSLLERMARHKSLF